jgi:hypothetical protein
MDPKRSQEVSETIRTVILDEMTSDHVPLVPIGQDDRELNEMVELLSAVDLTIRRHAYGEMGEKPLPGRRDVFDYTLGSARESMARHGVDAVWIVTGVELVPTAARSLLDGIAVLISVLSALSGRPVAVSVPMRVRFRAALVGKDGTILFYCRINDSNVGHDAKGKHASDRDGGNDLRDPTVARRYIRALNSEYREAVRQ